MSLAHHPADAALTEALARTPHDHYVIWNGCANACRPGSIPSTTFDLIEEIWRPVSLRTVLQRVARRHGGSGLNPEAVRNAVRMHQSAGRACYFLVRRTSAGDYVAVADVPSPSYGPRPLMAGKVVLGKGGERFGASPAERPASLAELAGGLVERTRPPAATERPPGETRESES